MHVTQNIIQNIESFNPTIGLSVRLRLAVTTLDCLSHSILAFLTILRGGSLQLLLQLPGNARNSFAAFAAFFWQLLQLLANIKMFWAVFVHAPA